MSIKKLIEEVIAESLKEVLGAESSRPSGDLPFQVGERVFVRTVTYHTVGLITAIGGGFLTLKNASWVADSGRFMNALRDGTLSEVEPIVHGTVRIAITSIVDVFEWQHSLDLAQK